MEVEEQASKQEYVQQNSTSDAHEFRSASCYKINRFLWAGFYKMHKVYPTKY